MNVINESWNVFKKTSLGTGTGSDWKGLLKKLGFVREPDSSGDEVPGGKMGNEWFRILYVGIGDDCFFNVSLKKSIGAATHWVAKPNDLDSLDFLRALAWPELLPTCMGIPWAQDLIEAWLKNK